MGSLLTKQSVFLIDLPRKTTVGSSETKTSFYEELVYFLKASTLHENIIAKLDSFDFSKTAHIAFVHTMQVSLFLSLPRSILTSCSGGSHEGDSWQRTGYCGLRRAVASLGLRTSTPLNIDYVVSILRIMYPNPFTLTHQTSSIGSLKDEFLQSIYLAAQGSYLPPTPYPISHSAHKLTHRRRHRPD